MTKIVKEAVEEYLKLNDFIELHKETIYEKLVEREEHITKAQGMEEDDDLLYAGNAAFVAESLALMSGIVSVGTKKENYTKASVWIKGIFPKAEDATPVFLTLTLIYIANKGWEEANETEDKERKIVWNRIHKRTNAFSSSIGDKVIKEDK